ncbi:MAG: M20/M25/M40 family metallo-hydrolase [Candidatus Roizmanbacteria bacterium]|nr:M20/M25/M40 family metallo-hydrolase [Candidatus Roizmanbacteria bacterium]
MSTEYQNILSPQDYLHDSELQEAFELINGNAIEKTIIDIARETGAPLRDTPDGHERYVVDRLALSPNEFRTRISLTELMKRVGLAVHDYPLGIIGQYDGQDNSLSPVVIMSHFDAVPLGGMYDGVAGIAGAIELIRAFNMADIRTLRSIVLLALTGEESSRFNIALFGSRGMFHGLTSEELASKRPGDMSIQKALENAGYSIDTVMSPLFSPENVYATVELHVDQTGLLEAQDTDLAIVESIASPDRREIIIGAGGNNEQQDYTYKHPLLIEINGRSGHSGATPMGKEFRLDGLVIAAELLSHIDRLNQQYHKKQLHTSIAVSFLDIEAQSLNKIPGETALAIQICGDDPKEIDQMLNDLNGFINRRNNYYARNNRHISPISPFETEKQRPTTVPLVSSSINYTLAARIALTVHSICNQQKYRNAEVVGTVGTCSVSKDGHFILGLDVRGTDADLRNDAMAHILSNIAHISRNLNVPYVTRQLPGSSLPVHLPSEVCSKAQKAIERHAIGSCIFTNSPAGHDTLNAASADIPASLLFIPSENGGIAHTPLEYTSPAALEKGAKAMAALVYALANEK